MLASGFRLYLLAWLLALAAVLAPSCTERANQKVFGSPQQAVDALIVALKAGDHGQLEAILGTGADDVLSSGDPVADKAMISHFLAVYGEKHALENQPDGSVVIVCGPNDWPMPIPIVKDDAAHGWVFDTEAGLDEVISRRVGHNELSAIQVCRAIVDAQQDYLAGSPDGSAVHHYARKFVSDPGTHDGLYWPKAQDETQESPLGLLAAEASDEGYAVSPSSTPRPYHGYYYRMLTGQGPDAPGGERSYLSPEGLLVDGFAVVAYPASYGNSGIMTFIVDKDGIVYQRDLGPGTATSAEAMAAFNPDSGWALAE